MVKSVLAYILLVTTGLVVAVVGASAHRAIPWWGVSLAIVMMLAGAVFARTWKLWAGLGVFALGWLIPTSFFAVEGPGGSVLIAGDPVGVVWVAGGALSFVVVSLVPRRLLMGSERVAN